MNILSVESVSRVFGPRTLFSDVSFGLQRGERLGIIGNNGSGKSSLLRIIAGVEPPDRGRVTTAGGLRSVYLPQVPDLAPHVTVRQTVYGSMAEGMRVLREYEALNECIQQDGGTAAQLAELGRLSARLDALGAWESEARAESLIARLGLAAVADRPVDQLSGGQRKRTAIARALVDQPDLLILDEPTNHIDTDTVAWLEEYLARTPCALLLVTHDRYLLDRLVQRVIEIDRGRCFVMNGNYSDYLEQKATRLMQESAAEDARRNLLRVEMAWLQRGARARTTKQKAHVERVYALMAERGVPNEQQVLIDIAPGRRLGTRVIELQDVMLGFADRTVLRQLSLELKPDERLGIIGANGNGKTTLLRAIAGRLPLKQGTLTVGETVQIGLYDQEGLDLPLEQRVIDYVRAGAELVRGRDGALQTVGKLLEQFLFSPDQQYRPIETLSGGERRRLQLVRRLIEGPNVLLLDEPTNDLDLVTLSVLESYLERYPGAVVVVSHDRAFLDRVVKRTLAIESDGTTAVYPGGFSAYLTYRPTARPAIEPVRKPARLTPAEPPAQAPPAAKPLRANERRELARLESSIAELETRISAIGHEMVEAADDYQRLHALSAELAVREAELMTAYEQWTVLAERA
jgi:ABC transport system ATP-binding/permease protein